jgi:hypothetical protein
MAEIIVDADTQDAERLSFQVRVAGDSSETTHDVTVARADFERLARGDETETQFIRRCFEFLLEREPSEAIMRTFDVSVIKTYFPEFEEEIAP